MGKRTQFLCLVFFPAALVVIGLMRGLVLEDPGEFWQGLMAIQISPSILLHDYFAVGGFAATLVNAGLLGLICCLLMKLLDIDVNGPFIAAVYTVIGFAFFGKNLLNVWPIWLGVLLYARTQSVSFKNFALVAFFGTTLGPLVSVLAFGPWLHGWAAAAAALGFGTLAGFVLPPLASHMLRFHDGYNVYNIGFTGGIVGSIVVAVLRSFSPGGFPGIEGPPMTGAYNMPIATVLVVFSLLSLVAGVLFDRFGERSLVDRLKRIHASSGRLVSDFTTIGDHPSVMVNMGLLGMLSCGFVIALGGDFNGPVVGGILTVVAFAAFGKHSRNCIPILAGVVIAILVTNWDLAENHTTPLIIAGLFGTTLAPVAGQYGVLAGLAAGFLHVSVVMNVGFLHGGVNLYNNGFAGGFTAAVLVPIIVALQKGAKPS